MSLENKTAADWNKLVLDITKKVHEVILTETKDLPMSIQVRIQGRVILNLWCSFFRWHEREGEKTIQNLERTADELGGEEK